ARGPGHPPRQPAHRPACGRVLRGRPRLPLPVTRVPEVVCRKALAVGADRWLDDLPLLVASVEQEWGIAVGDAFTDATEAFVAEGTRADGSAAVVKLAVPRGGEAARNESAGRRRTGGG